jgi:hypothetical protein
MWFSLVYKEMAVYPLWMWFSTTRAGAVDNSVAISSGVVPRGVYAFHMKPKRRLASAI